MDTNPRETSIGRRAASEGLGTAFLLAAVVGSGIMGERLAGGNLAMALLANAVATGAALVALIVTFGPISGAHFNPAVSLVAVTQGGLPLRELPAYVTAQVVGAFLGVGSANAMFGKPLFAWSHHIRAGIPQGLGEIVATFGLLAVCWRKRSEAPFAVGAYITAAYWFTSSTSFANPAVTLARMTTDTFAGIRPQDIPTFLAGQTVGLVAALVVLGWLMPPTSVHAVSSPLSRPRSRSVEV